MITLIVFYEDMKMLQFIRLHIKNSSLVSKKNANFTGK